MDHEDKTGNSEKKRVVKSRKITLEVIIDQPEADWIWKQFGNNETVNGMEIIAIHSAHVIEADEIIDIISDSLDEEEIELPEEIVDRINAYRNRVLAEIQSTFGPQPTTEDIVQLELPIGDET